MNRTVFVRRAIALSWVLGLAVAGCELAVDFDRTLIDAGSVDASIADVVVTDSPIGVDAAKDAQGGGDATTDAGVDATADAPTDAGTDVHVPTDSGVDAAVDAPDDAPADADDAG